VLLGWTDIGFVYLFSNRTVGSAEDLKKTKLWVWQGDPIAEKTFAHLNVPYIPLSVMDVMTSLQTGLVDTVYSSPLAAIALRGTRARRRCGRSPSRTPRGRF
jgi:TRAP-type C4-dicarboxylate transport system substrate-binding protein